MLGGGWYWATIGSSIGTQIDKPISAPSKPIKDTTKIITTPPVDTIQIDTTEIAIIKKHKIDSIAKLKEQERKKAEETRLAKEKEQIRNDLIVRGKFDLDGHPIKCDFKEKKNEIITYYVEFTTSDGEFHKGTVLYKKDGENLKHVRDNIY